MHRPRYLKKRYFFGLVLLVILVWAAGGILPYIPSLKPWIGDRGTFGDMFGAVNSLFSALSFLGVLYAIFLQKAESQSSARQLEISLITAQIAALGPLLQHLETNYQAHLANRPKNLVGGVDPTVEKEWHDALQALGRRRTTVHSRIVQLSNRLDELTLAATSSNASGSNLS